MNHARAANRIASSKAAPGAGAAAVQVEGVAKYFGDVAAVDHVDLDIVHGEFFSLLGPSGCGKTTLLRLIGGFEFPDRGVIRIGGADVTGRPPYERPTNMIFQHLALFPHMDVFENVAFGLRMKRFETAQARRRVEDALALVRMSGYERRAVDQLSGGQQQRIAIARALVNDPVVLLLDEPLGSLDLNLRTQLQEELRRIHKELQSTFIFVTHDQGEALTMSNRIAVMNEGRIVQIAMPETLYQHPRNRFVAKFIGRSNILSGCVTGRCDNGAYTANVAGVPVAFTTERQLRNGENVSLSLRYEDIHVCPPTDGSTGTSRDVVALPGVIIDRSYAGALSRVSVRSEDLIFVAEVRSADCLAVGGEGSSVRMEWDLTSSWLLEE